MEISVIKSLIYLFDFQYSAEYLTIASAAFCEHTLYIKNGILLLSTKLRCVCVVIVIFQLITPGNVIPLTILSQLTSLTTLPSYHPSLQLAPQHVEQMTIYLVNVYSCRTCFQIFLSFYVPTLESVFHHRNRRRRRCT